MIDDDDIEGPQQYLLHYGGDPPHVRGSDTSKAAAEFIRSIRGPLCRAVAKAIAASGERGMICYEVERQLGLTHQTASARFADLKNGGWIVETKRRRRTQSGCTAVVHVIAEEVREKFEPRKPKVTDEDLL